MAGSIIQTELAEALDNLLNDTANWSTSDMFVGLSYAVPSDANGTGYDEVTEAGYSRQAVTAAQWDLPTAAEPSEVDNNVTVTWGPATANWDNAAAGTIQAIGFHTLASGGSLLAWAPTSTTPTVNNGDSFQIAIGDINIQLAQEGADGMTTYAHQQILEQWANKGDYTPPGDLYIGLSTTDPAVDGTSISEPVGFAYARVQIPATDWAAATNANPSVKILDTNGVTFPQASGGAWGNIRAWVLFDDNVPTNAIAYGPVSPLPQAVNDGDTASFAVNEIQLELGGSVV